MRIVVVAVLAVLAGSATATAKSNVTVKLLGTVVGKPPVTVYKVKLTLKNDSKKARWFALPTSLGPQMPMPERLTVTNRETLSFKEAKSVLFYRYYAGQSVVIITVPAKGSLILDGWTFDSYVKNPTFQVWELKKAMFAGRPVTIQKFKTRKIHVRNPQDWLLLGGSRVRPPLKLQLHIHARYKLSLKN